MSSTSTSAAVPTVALPNEQELEEAERLLAQATERISTLAWRVRRLAEHREDVEEEEARKPHHRQPGDPVPTFEDVGRLFAYGVTLHGYLGELSGYVDDIAGQEALKNLDYVRLTGGGNA